MVLCYLHPYQTSTRTGASYSGQSWYMNIKTRYWTWGYTQDERLKQCQVLSSVNLLSTVTSINCPNFMKFNKNTGYCRPLHFYPVRIQQRY